MDTLIYQVSYPRVRFDPDTDQVAPNLIPLLSEPCAWEVRNSTWIHDTRRPEPLDAQTGMYNSIQIFATDNAFLSPEVNYAHFDWSNSSYYTLGKLKKYVLARIRVSGDERYSARRGSESIPLPEGCTREDPNDARIPINSAGPRDSLTGFPIGGAGAFVNQTGRVCRIRSYRTSGIRWGSCFFMTWGTYSTTRRISGRAHCEIKQPTVYTCTSPAYLMDAAQEQVTRRRDAIPTGQCDFTFIAYAGAGARYQTPIGPISFRYGLQPESAGISGAGDLRNGQCL